MLSVIETVQLRSAELLTETERSPVNLTGGSAAAVHRQDGLVGQVDAADAGAFEDEFGLPEML